MKLFDDIERTYSGFMDLHEDSYHFYQRSAREEFAAVRNTLDNWFLRYPIDKKKEFKSSFHKHFDDSFFELFLHELFMNLGFEIEIHPELQNSSNRPDFKINKCNLEIIVEAKVVIGKSIDDKNLERRLNQFLDAINKCEFDGYALDIDELIFKTIDQPSTSNVIKFIKRKLEAIDHVHCLNEYVSGNIHAMPTFEIDDEKLNFVFRVIPLDKNKIEKKNPGIYMYPTVAYWGGGEHDLRKAIINKANRYGKLNKPFLLCVNTRDQKTTSEMDIINAIWGTESISVKGIVPKLGRYKDGIFYDNNGPKLEHLSGVLITKINQHNIHVAEHWFYENPFATHKLDFASIGLSSIHVIYGELVKVERKTFNEIIYAEQSN